MSIVDFRQFLVCSSRFPIDHGHGTASQGSLGGTYQLKVAFWKFEFSKMLIRRTLSCQLFSDWSIVTSIMFVNQWQWGRRSTCVSQLTERNTDYERPNSYWLESSLTSLLTNQKIADNLTFILSAFYKTQTSKKPPSKFHNQKCTVVGKRKNQLPQIFTWW